MNNLKEWLRARWFNILMLMLLCVIVVALSGCGSNREVIVHEHPGTTVVIDDQTQYLTYRERFGGYTMTPYGYVPIREAGPYGIVTSTPGYTWSKSIYYDQRPEAFGIYPVRRKEIHVITSGSLPASIDYVHIGCSVDAGGQPYLREYQTKITVDGKLVPAYGTACRQPNGDWKLVGGLKPVR